VPPGSSTSSSRTFLFYFRKRTHFERFCYKPRKIARIYLLWGWNTTELKTKRCYDFNANTPCTVYNTLMIRIAFLFNGDIHVVPRAWQISWVRLSTVLYRTKSRDSLLTGSEITIAFPVNDKNSRGAKISILAKVYLLGGMSRESDDSPRLVLHRPLGA